MSDGPCGGSTVGVVISGDSDVDSGVCVQICPSPFTLSENMVVQWDRLLVSVGAVGCLPTSFRVSFSSVWE